MLDYLGDITDKMIDAQEADDRYPDPTIVYRYFDEDGVLLYVGISRQITYRHYQHTGKSWTFAARYMQISYFPTRALAAHAEFCAVRDEEPEENLKYHPVKWPRRDEWYRDKFGGSLAGECVSWFSLEEWRKPRGCENPRFVPLSDAFSAA